jgi:NAD(P)-dependent dehydrogenase (short-subunit alcohol dehydrogenase family)
LFKETFEVNVFRTVAITESIQPSINAGGAILNISSSLGSIATLLKRSGSFNAARSDRESSVYPYSASKSALNNLTVQWAREEQKKGSGIRVVAVSPGTCMSQLGSHLSFV